ncbi:hypothetical protein HTS61_21145 [Escherichia coli]|nr:hypothetical protein [Escherichia coli]
MNVPGGSIAITPATRAPGGKSPLARFPHLIPFGYRVKMTDTITPRTPSRHPYAAV